MHPYSRFRGSYLPYAVEFSTPVPMQYEKFYMPDNIRIMDAIVETLTY